MGGDEYAVSKKARLLLEENDNPAAMEEVEDKPAVMEEAEDKPAAMEEEDNPGVMDEIENRAPVMGEERESDINHFTDAEDDGSLNYAIKRYYIQLNESKGYDIDYCPWSGAPFTPRSLSDELFYERALKVIDFAMVRINSHTLDKLGKYYKFVSIEKAVEGRSLSVLLTFKAKEFDANAIDTDADAPVKIMQTRVWAPPFDEFIVEEWRFKPEAESKKDTLLMEEKENNGKDDPFSQSVIESYYKVLRESHGYDIDIYPPPCIFASYTPRSLSDPLFYERALEVMKFAMDRINSETIVKDGKRYEFVSIEKAVESHNFHLLLTFKAKEFDAATKDTSDADAAPIKIMQTRVWVRPFDPVFSFIEWRFKPGFVMGDHAEAAVIDDEESEPDNDMFSDSDEDCTHSKDDPSMKISIERYYKVLRESQGYDIDIYPPCCVRSTFIPRDLSNPSFYKTALEVINFAMDRINSQSIEKDGKCYEFVSIEKAVETRTLSLLLTFKAKEFDAATKDTSDAEAAPIKILQTTVWAPPFQEFVFEEWRFKPGTT